MTNKAVTYSYKCQEDGREIQVEVDGGVFVPTKTSNLLISSIKHAVTGRYRILDLGCGCGCVGCCLAVLGFADGAIAASDVSLQAVDCCRRNARSLGLECDARLASLFDCWAGERFGLIVDDISGVAEEIARRSSWFPEFAPCGAGPDGAAWTTAVIDQADDHLVPGGILVFPILSLSNEARILARAKEKFRELTKIGQQFYPISQELGTGSEVLEKLMAEGKISLRKLGGNWAWWTTVYEARFPR